jgi:hypothetical protein
MFWLLIFVMALSAVITFFDLRGHSRLVLFILQILAIIATIGVYLHDNGTINFLKASAGSGL